MRTSPPANEIVCRPWITVVLDRATCCILAHAFSFGAEPDPLLEPEVLTSGDAEIDHFAMDAITLSSINPERISA